jgi:ubiquinone/menaquinone biosynthesis C-methylase UbiE
MSELNEKKSATGLYFSLQSKGETLPLESASFNWVLLSEVIEHLADPLVLVNEIYRVLKPGGFLYLTTPNYASHWPFLEKFIDLIGKAPKMAGEQHISPFTPDSLRLLLKSWTIELLTSFYRFSPFYAQISFKLAKRVLRRELSVENKHGMLLVCIARKNGLQ